MYLNYRKIMLSGATAAVIVGAGGTALAVSGSDTTSGKPAPSSSSAPTPKGKAADKHKAAHKHKAKGAKVLRRLEHGTFVTKGKDGKAVTHDLIHGSVTAVSATSITVRAEDSKSQTFSVTKDTTVKEKAKGKKIAAATIAKIAKGDHVVVTGTGTGTPVAQHIVEVPAK